MTQVVRVSGGQDLARVTRALRQQGDAGRARARELSKALRGEAKPMVPALRKSIKRLPSKRESRRRGRKSLRAEMARSVRLQVKTSGRQAGVSVFMDPRKMPDGKKALPGYFERIPGKTSLRHPVFGNRDVWRQNQNVPPQGYFTRTVRPVERRAVEACQRIVERAAREIEDA